MKKSLLVGATLFASMILLSACSSSNSGSEKSSEKATSSKVEKSENSNGYFKNDVYETKNFKIKIDGIKFIQDVSDKKAMYVTYTFTNKSKKNLEPSFTWAEFIHVKQDAGQSWKDLGNSGSLPVEQDETQDAKLLKVNSDEVKPQGTIQTAELFPLENTGKIVIHFANLDTYDDIGTKTVQVK